MHQESVSAAAALVFVFGFACTGAATAAVCVGRTTLLAGSGVGEEVKHRGKFVTARKCSETLVAN